MARAVPCTDRDRPDRRLQRLVRLGEHCEPSGMVAQLVLLSCSAPTGTAVPEEACAVVRDRIALFTMRGVRQGGLYECICTAPKAPCRLAVAFTFSRRNLT